MDFALDDDQELLRQSARTMLAAECPTRLVRAHMDDPSVADVLWKHLCGWTELSDGPLVDLCLFAEESGAVVAPGPFFPTVALFAPLLAAIGEPAASLRAAVLRGETTGTVALAGRSGEWVPNSEPVKCFVPEAERVEHVAVVSSAQRGAEQVEVRILHRPDATFMATIDPSRRLASVPAPATDARPERGGTDGGGVHRLAASLVDDVVEKATVVLAAEMLGTIRWLVDQTLAYAKERVQFGRPIGSFQAVQHKLADMALARERAWAAVYYAAMCHDSMDWDRHRASHVAKIAAGSAAKRAAKDGIQIHGGIGYTWEHDLHLFLRRAYGSEHFLGTSEWHQDRLAELLLE
ncbi:MAG: acyl-CoA dehydrogenase family protein [Acidimicrobiales bacterium]